ARRLELAQPPADRLRRADEPARERLLGLRRRAPLLVGLPHVALAGIRDAVTAIVGEAEDEERPARRFLARSLVRVRAHEARHHRDVRIRRIVAELVRVLRELDVVAVHPRARRLRRDELEAERAQAPAAGARDGEDVRARDPERRGWPLVGPWPDVARGKLCRTAPGVG